MNEIEFVNHVLARANIPPVPALDTGDEDVALIQQLLKKHKNDLLSAGWWFNKEDVKLLPKTDGTITLPTDVLEIKGSNTYTRRKGTLYDLSTNSNKFTSPVTLKVTRDLDLEDTPYQAQSYLLAHVCIDFVDARDGDNDTINLLGRDMREKFIQLQEEDTRRSSRGILNLSSVRSLRGNRN